MTYLPTRYHQVNVVNALPLAIFVPLLYTLYLNIKYIKYKCKYIHTCLCTVVLWSYAT